MRLEVLLIAFVFGVPAIDGAPLHAQGASDARDAHAIAESIRQRRNVSHAVALLRQARGPEPQARLDAIADSVANIVISYPGSDTAALHIRSLAREVLTSATTGIRAGIPYAGGGERLLRIAQQASNVGERAAALSAITRLPSEEEALAILEAVAKSQNSVARLAITLLMTEMEEPGLAILENLYRTAAVTQPRARLAIELLGEDRKWDGFPSDESRSARLAKQCSDAAAALQTGKVGEIARSNPATIRDLQQCDATAGQVLPSIWMTVGADSAVLQQLIIASSRVLDRRIESALVTVARDRTKPQIVREAAIAVLFVYAEPPASVIAIVTSQVPSTRWTIAFGRASHRDRKSGTDRIHPGFDARLVAMLREIADAEPLPKDHPDPRAQLQFLSLVRLVSQTVSR